MLYICSTEDRSQLSFEQNPPGAFPNRNQEFCESSFGKSIVNEAFKQRFAAGDVVLATEGPDGKPKTAIGRVAATSVPGKATNAFGWKLQGGKVVKFVKQPTDGWAFAAILEFSCEDNPVPRLDWFMRGYSKKDRDAQFHSDPADKAVMRALQARRTVRFDPSLSGRSLIATGVNRPSSGQSFSGRGKFSKCYISSIDTPTGATSGVPARAGSSTGTWIGTPSLVHATTSPRSGFQARGATLAPKGRGLRKCLLSTTRQKLRTTLKRTRQSKAAIIWGIWSLTLIATACATQPPPAPPVREGAAHGPLAKWLYLDDGEGLDVLEEQLRGVPENVLAVAVTLPEEALLGTELAWDDLNACVYRFGYAGGDGCYDAQIAPVPGLKVVWYMRDPLTLADFSTQDDALHQRAAIILSRAGEPFDWQLGNAISLTVPGAREFEVRALLREDPVLGRAFVGRFQNRDSYMSDYRE